MINGRLLKVTASGYEIVKNPQVRFIRHRGMLALPTPQQGGNVATLANYLNCDCNSDFALFVAWLLGAFSPTGPYPILILEGPPGSAKTTAAQTGRSLIDPNEAALRTLPKDEWDLRVYAKNSHVLAFDNLSGLSPGMADALCRMSTGGAFSKRKLYTDHDEVLFQGSRPMILNGIDRLTGRSDLVDRAIVLELPLIDERKRKTERELTADFDIQAGHFRRSRDCG
jgi:hypothetical protein